MLLGLVQAQVGLHTNQEFMKDFHCKPFFCKKVEKTKWKEWGEIVMPLGKHKSKKIIEMANGYLLCLYDRNKLTGEIKN